MHIALFSLCFCSESLAAFWFLSASFTLYALLLYLWLFFFQFIAYLTQICFACRVVAHNTNV